MLSVLLSFLNADLLVDVERACDHGELRSGELAAILLYNLLGWGATAGHDATQRDYQLSPRVIRGRV